MPICLPDMEDFPEMEDSKTSSSGTVVSVKDRLAPLYKILRKRHPKVMRVMMEDVKKTTIPQWLLDEFEKNIMKECSSESSMQTAVLVLNTYAILKPDATKNDLNRAAVLGWAYQSWQMVNHVLDDQLDRRALRDSHETWGATYDFEEKSVVYDFLMLQSAMFSILNAEFGQEPKYYLPITKLFLEITKSTWRGNRWKAEVAYENVRSGAINSDEWTYENWKEIGLLKNVDFNMFYPIAIAMVLAGFDWKADTESFGVTRKICDKLSTWALQIRDLLDCFPRDTEHDAGHVDIRNGEISWMYLKAKELCRDDADRMILAENYGIDNAEAAEKVKKLYKELDLPSICREDVDKIYAETMEEIKRELSLDEGPGKAVHTYMEIMIEKTDFLRKREK